jgi:two-component system response regulator YesN
VYKVVIADDEILARVGIKSLIPWAEYGFELLGECENGHVALEMVTKLRPDILITDIKMPLMDGIELLREMKANGLPTKVIVLSSYDDFYLVKEAMKLGAVDYILKLEMEADELLRILKDTCSSIETDRNEQHNNLLVAEQINQNLVVIKEVFLKSLIYGKQKDEEEIISKFELYHIDLPQENILCLNIKIFSTGRMAEGGALLYTNLLEEIINNYGKGTVFYSDSYICTALCSLHTGKSTNAFINTVNRMSKDIKNSLKDSMNLDVSIGISNLFQKYYEIGEAYRQAYEAVTSDYAYLAGSIVAYNDMAGQNIRINNTPFEEELKALGNALRTYNSNEIWDIFNQIIKKLYELSFVSGKHLNGTLYILIYMMNNFIRNNNLLPYEIWGKDIDPYIQLERLKVASDYAIWMKNIRDHIVYIIEQEMNNNAAILRAKQYINQHYQENIKLEEVAEHLAMSPSYFSRYFSKATGQSFTEYVTDIRIKIAKELLRSAQYRVNEVSDMVGYDSHYFSRIFKKATGLSPLEYKSQNVCEDKSD